jgi:hypothetical protein
MKQEDIDFFNRIDPKKECGSIQAILSEGNLQALSFESVSKRIIMNILNDRQAILTENKAMSSYLKQIGHYSAEAIGLKQ